MEDMRKGSCPLCRETDLVRAKPTGLVGRNVLVPLFAGHENRGAPTWDEEGQPFGELSAIVCRECGFMQWFVDVPLSIPEPREIDESLGEQTKAWAPLPGSKKPDEGPYR